MTFFTNLINNTNLDFNTLSIGFLGGLTCFIGGTLIKNIWFKDSSANLTVETPTIESGVDTIRELSNLEVSPTLHHLTSGNLRYLQNILDNKKEISTQTDLFQEVNVNFVDKEIQVSEVLNKLEQGIQTMPESIPNLEISSNDLINLLDSPISSLPTITQSKLNKFNLEIDLSSVNKTLEEMSPNELFQNTLMDKGIDLSLTEAYVTIPELVGYGDQLVQYLTWV